MQDYKFYHTKTKWLKMNESTLSCIKIPFSFNDVSSLISISSYTLLKNNNIKFSGFNLEKMCEFTPFL